MKISDLFKDKVEAAKDQPMVNLSGTITLPMDLMLEVILRQQSQIATALAALNTRIDVNEQVISQSMERVEHVHADLVNLRQKIEEAMTHPAERMNTEPEKKLLN